jgi:hypothetical protein
MTQAKKTANPKVTIIASKGANQAINYLLEDRDELDWLVAIGRNKNGDIFFYDTGGDIIQDLGAIEYIKERIVRDYFGESDNERLRRSVHGTSVQGFNVTPLRFRPGF